MPGGLEEGLLLPMEFGGEIRIHGALAIHAGRREQSDRAGPVVAPAGIVEDGVEADGLERHAVAPSRGRLAADIVQPWSPIGIVEPSWRH